MQERTDPSGTNKTGPVRESTARGRDEADERKVTTRAERAEQPPPEPEPREPVE